MSVLVLPLDLAKRVERGAKTMHRIKPVKGRSRPDLDESLPVQVRNANEVLTLCRVHVLDVVDGLLSEITESEWRADGHESRGAYFAWWRETVDHVEAPASQDEPYGQIPVWVVRFQPEQRRFLVARAGATKEPPESAAAHGYTSSPASGLAGERQVAEPIGPSFDQRLELRRRQVWAREYAVISGSIDRLMDDPHMRSEIAGEVRVLQRRLVAIDRQLHGIAA